MYHVNIHYSDLLDAEQKKNSLAHIFNNFFRFYLQCLLSEIVQPLYPTRMLKNDIRERQSTAAK